MSRPRTVRSVVASAAALGALLLGGLPAHAADTPPGTDPRSTAQTVTGGATRISANLAGATGTVTAFVSLDTEAGTEVAAHGGSAADVKRARVTTEETADAVVPQQMTKASAASSQPQRIATVTNLMPGTLVVGDAAKIRALAADKRVTGISRIIPKSHENASTVTFTKALATWQQTGQTGQGVTIGIIDTGIDYTHADFGGAGTSAAYQAAYGTDGTQAVPAGSYDPTKFVAGVGWDFAGTTYDAAGTGSQLVPVPDANPIDTSEAQGGGHGSHVSGSAAGFGIDASGKTYRGFYRTLSDVSGWQIGPGAAPQATLMALKVFGDDGGSTSLVIPALDKAADPNGDGSFNDHLDIVNLSLGSDYAPADDPDSIAVGRLTALGTVVVTAAGNGGDLEDVAGSPGNAESSIAVANSSGSPISYAAMDVVGAADPALDKAWPVQNSVAYPSNAPDVTAPVAYLGDRVDGCTTFTAAQKAAVAGKIAWLWWDDDESTRLCGSAARAANAAAAGAVGAIFTSSTTVFSAGITGSKVIPVAQLTKSTTDALQASAKAGALTVHIGPSLDGAYADTSTPDVLNPSSARGDHGSLGWAKPDVAAPGTNIVSVAATTGTGSANFLGTSMSAPNVTGIAALVRQAHPGWTVAQVKAAIVNTATHDVHTGENRTGLVYGPARVGSGRVDALGATTTTLLAYDTQSPAATSVTFGVVDVGATTVRVQRTVTVQNTGSTAKTVQAAFTRSTTAGRATIGVSPSSFTVPAGQTKLVTLTLTIDPATVARDIDPTQSTTQGGIDREYVSRLSGRLTLTSGGTELRVPVQAVPKPSSALTASAPAFANPSATTATITLQGRTLTAKGWHSFATPLVLAATSPKLETLTPEQAASTSVSTVASGDLRYVGWGSTAPGLAAAGQDATTGVLNIGIATDASWADLGTVMYPIVYLDVDGDGTPDYETQVFKQTATDNTVAWTFDLATGDVVGSYLADEYAGDVDATVFDGSTVVVPIPLSVAPKGAKPTVTVETQSYYAPDGSSIIDKVAPFQVDPYDPPLWFDSNQGTRQTSLVPSTPATIVAHKGPGAAGTKLLMLYPQNSLPTNRVQVLDVTVPSATATTTTLAVTGSHQVGGKQTLTASVAPAKATGTVTFLDGTTTLGTAAVTSAGRASLAVSLGGGSHALTAAFAPATADYAASTSAAVTWQVNQATSTTTLALTPGTISYGRSATARVTVTAAAASPGGGTVQVRDGSTVVGTATLSGTGRTLSATVALPTSLAVGRHTLTATFAGTASVAGSTSGAVRLTVTKTVPTLSVTTSSWTVPAGTAPTLTITATGPAGAPAPTGTVAVLSGFAVVGYATLSNGTASVTLPALSHGQLVLVGYAGDGSYLPTLWGGIVRVR